MSIVTAAIVKSTKPWTRARKERQAEGKQLVEEREASGRGRGLFSLAEFSPGELICPMDGRRDLPWKISEEENRNAILDEAAGYLIVPDVTSIGWHRANHSCVPNAALTAHRGISAVEHIVIGQEITVDYGWHLAKNAATPCRCGEEDCLGTVGVTRPEEIPRRIAHYVKHRLFDAFFGFSVVMAHEGHRLHVRIGPRFQDAFQAWMAKYQYFYR